MFKIAGCHTEGHGDFLYGRGIDGRQCPLCRRPDQGVRRRVFDQGRICDQSGESRHDGKREITLFPKGKENDLI